MIEDKEKLQIWHNILFIKGFEVLGLGFNLSQLIFSGDSTFERKLLYQVFECFKIEISFFVVFVICQYCGTVYVHFFAGKKLYTFSLPVLSYVFICSHEAICTYCVFKDPS